MGPEYLEIDTELSLTHYWPKLYSILHSNKEYDSFQFTQLKTYIKSSKHLEKKPQLPQLFSASVLYN